MKTFNLTLDKGVGGQTTRAVCLINVPTITTPRAKVRVKVYITNVIFFFVIQTMGIHEMYF